ncbi:MAG: hypothetical protein KC420_18955, partial [Myxococcales bacterium]|nr:hypothetical protein [Myxococcales bacterium]
MLTRRAERGTAWARWEPPRGEGRGANARLARDLHQSTRLWFNRTMPTRTAALHTLPLATLFDRFLAARAP